MSDGRLGAGIEAGGHGDARGPRRLALHVRVSEELHEEVARLAGPQVPNVEQNELLLISD